MANVLVCPNHGKVLRCIKTGITVRFQGDHVRRGDRYTCPVDRCSTDVVVCASEGAYDEHVEADEICIDE